MKVAISLIFLWAFVCLIKAKPAQERLEQVEDMLMTKEQKEVYNQLKNGRVRRAAAKHSYLWDKGIIYYTFHRNLDKAGQNLAKKAIKHWEDNTCLKFEKRKNQRFYAEFQYDGDCRAAIGYAKKPKQLISIGSKQNPCSLGSTIHEIGHTVGFFHEQGRQDRDDYVKVIEKNMRPGQWVKDQFKKVDPRWIDSRGKDYDYGSIMHYSRYQGNNKAGAVVLKPINPESAEIGEREDLSQGDIAQTKAMYKCNANDESELAYNPEEDTDTDTTEKDDTDGPKPGDIEE